jgi:hypothetical protein
VPTGLAYIATQRFYLPYSGAFACLKEARLEVAYHLGICFNLDRRRSNLVYRLPRQFERYFQLNLP